MKGNFVPLTKERDCQITCGRYLTLAGRLRQSFVGAAESKTRPHTDRLDIQVLYVERIVFDELAAGFYVFAHQRGEDGFALGDVFELH